MSRAVQLKICLLFCLNFKEYHLTVYKTIQCTSEIMTTYERNNFQRQLICMIVLKLNVLFDLLGAVPDEV